MRRLEGRYAVCDEARRAPNNLEVRADGSAGHRYWGEDGELQRFDDLREAQDCAKTVWQDQGRHHAIVVKDKLNGEAVVQVFDAEPHDTKPGSGIPDE